MRLSDMRLINYRCFRDCEIAFDERLSVLVGTNGAGKSAVLDAASIAIGSFLLGIDGLAANSIHRDDVRHIPYQIGSTVDLQPQFPAVIEARGAVGGRNLSWSRALTRPEGRTTIKDAKEISAVSQEMQAAVRAGNRDLFLPIISYYGTGRLWAQKKQKKDAESLHSFTRFSGYIDCLDVMSNEKLMLKWLEKMTFLELQKKEPVPELAAVKSALVGFYSRATGYADIDLRYGIETQGLEVLYSDGDGARQRASFKELSDGYRNTLSMIADIAYRMAVLNPQLLDKATEETPGVVLIDEVDLHLHPTWQQRILRDLTEIFPKVQFIVTTHAPSVIHAVAKEHLIVLDGCRAYYPTTQTYGRDANTILSGIMGAHARPIEIQEKMNNFYADLDRGNLTEANRLLSELEDAIGTDDPEITGARVSLALEGLAD